MRDTLRANVPASIVLINFKAAAADDDNEDDDNKNENDEGEEERMKDTTVEKDVL